MNHSHYDIVVMGCGPAGCITALGLKRMGYRVAVVGQIRKHCVTEGVSERVVQSLQHLKLPQTLNCIGPATARHVNWNGASNAANTERLIERRAFDRALLQDIEQQGVKVYQERILQSQHQGHRWEIQTREDHRYYADFVVEARGRAAPLGRTDYVRGPESLALGQNWQVQQSNVSTTFAQAISVKQGWLWLALRQDGNLFTQFSISAHADCIPNKDQIKECINEQLKLNSDTHQRLPKLVAKGESLARGSTPILIDVPAKNHQLRVGDAALAADPLSGNGIFLALSSALSASAVINTILQKPHHRALAQTFYRDRLHHLFYRFGRIGRDFYRMEQGYSRAQFWRERLHWPDDKPAHHSGSNTLRQALRPVLNGNFIEQKRVVVCPEHPLGIWRIGDQLAVDRFAQQLSPQPSTMLSAPTD